MRSDNDATPWRSRELGVKRLGGQMVFYLLFFAFIGYFADQPEFDYLGGDEALVKLAVRHAGRRIGECRALDASEIEERAPNMRVPLVCPRERSAVQVELALNQDVVFVNSIEPAGLHNDGISAAYERFNVKAGPMHVGIKVIDDTGSEGPTHQFEGDYVLKPTDILVIEFSDGFNIQHRR
jgi:hypothetical protein|tara:strand:+ start:177 stop:719 length:543 start_codon:yes stop_codon:yes gene_type:complete